MDIPLDVEVQCIDGRCGRALDIVVNPDTLEITHVVVGPPHAHDRQRLVPVALISAAGPTGLKLQCTVDEFSCLEPFLETRFMKVTVQKPVAPGFMYAWPDSYVSRAEYVPVEIEGVPDDEIAVHRGARVEAQDGPIGWVDELLVDPATEKITHLILRKHHLFGRRDVVVPVSQIDLIEADVIYLKMSKQAVGDLPAAPRTDDRGQKQGENDAAE